mmetsp:Transcript_8666/g.23830  ORF Transcript_8666/g.23830 Transcript_8666/m.23830 type:complete len:453 (+) Transcript_8666:609-1967(+)
MLRVEEMALLVAAIGLRGELNHCVERNRHIGSLLSRHAHEVGIDEPEDALVRHHQQGLADALHLHDHWLEAVAHVQVGLSSRVAVAQLVALAQLVLLGHLLLDLLVGHAVADAGVDLVQVGQLPPLHLLPRDDALGLRHAPLDHLVGDETRSLACAPERRGPQARGAGRARFRIEGDHLLSKLAQLARVGGALGGEGGVPANLALHIVLRLAMSRQVEALRALLQIHHQLGDAAEEVAVHVVDLVAVHVRDLDPREVPLRPIIVQWLIGLAHVGGARLQVRNSLLQGLARILGRELVHVAHIGGNLFLVGARALDEQDAAARVLELVHAPPPLLDGRVVRVKEGNHGARVIAPQRLKDVAHGRLTTLENFGRRLVVMRVEERRGLEGPADAPAVVSHTHVDALDAVEEGEVVLDAPRHARLATCRQANHGHNNALARVRAHCVEEHGVGALH